MVIILRMEFSLHAFQHGFALLSVPICTSAFVPLEVLGARPELGAVRRGCHYPHPRTYISVFLSFFVSFLLYTVYAPRPRWRAQAFACV